MLQGSEQLSNPTGNNTGETVRGFRFGDGDGAVATVALPVSNTTCPSYVCAAGTSVQLAARPGADDRQRQPLAADDLTPLAEGKQHSHDDHGLGRRPGVGQRAGRDGRQAAAGEERRRAPTRRRVNPPMMSGDGWQWKYPHWRPAVAETKTRGWLIITGGVDYGNGVYGWNWGKMLVQLGAGTRWASTTTPRPSCSRPGTGTWTFSPGWEREITEATALTTTDGAGGTRLRGVQPLRERFPRPGRHGRGQRHARLVLGRRRVPRPRRGGRARAAAGRRGRRPARRRRRVDPAGLRSRAARGRARSGCCR